MRLPATVAFLPLSAGTSNTWKRQAAYCRLVHPTPASARIQVQVSLSYGFLFRRIRDVRMQNCWRHCLQPCLADDCDVAYARYTSNSLMRRFDETSCAQQVQTACIRPKWDGVRLLVRLRRLSKHGLVHACFQILRAGHYDKCPKGPKFMNLFQRKSWHWSFKVQYACPPWP